MMGRQADGRGWWCCLCAAGQVPGVTTPMTYFGMWKSFFAWHVVRPGSRLDHTWFSCCGWCWECFKCIKRMAWVYCVLMISC